MPVTGGGAECVGLPGSFANLRGRLPSPPTTLATKCCNHQPRDTQISVRLHAYMQGRLQGALWCPDHRHRRLGPEIVASCCKHSALVRLCILEQFSRGPINIIIIRGAIMIVKTEVCAPIIPNWPSDTYGLGEIINNAPNNPMAPPRRAFPCP